MSKRRIAAATEALGLPVAADADAVEDGASDTRGASSMMIRMDTPILGPHLLAAIRAVLAAYRHPHYSDDDWEADQVAYIRTAAQIDGLGLLAYAEGEQIILTARAICLAQGCREDVDLPEQTNRALCTAHREGKSIFDPVIPCDCLCHGGSGNLKQREM